MKEYYDHLVKNKITPNGVFVLHATYKSYMYPNFVNFQHEQYRLVLTGFLTEESTGPGKVYKITDKGLHLIRECENIMSKMKRTKKTDIPFSDWEENIVRYNKLFPAGKKPGSSVSFRTNPKELFAIFGWFFKEYPEYTWDDVFKATDKYMEPFDASNDYTFAQTSKYFIKKDDKSRNTTSTLATMCYNIAEGNDQAMNTGYHYFGP
jgi:hypothetical protein